MTEGGWRIGVDTGGTFTDLVAVSPGGEVRLRKVSSTPAAPSAAVFEALQRTDLDLDREVDYFVLGTTIATNAVIQRRGARTIFVTTEGFEDNLFIQRIDRHGLYDLQWVKAVPYSRRRDTIGVRERILSDGSVRSALTDAELDRVIGCVRDRLALADGAAIAVSLLFAYVNDAHERLLADRLRGAFPETPISVSSEVAPIWREYERSSTTVMDAFVKPIVAGFTAALEDGLSARSMSGWHALIKSNGGQVPVARASLRPAEIILSGLAGGMIAGNYWARAAGSPKAVTLDMGGTSADVGVVVDGQLKFSGLYEVEWGVPIALPTIDVSTIGAGGSSIASIDYGGLLCVGPESAGADPGPACYGKGGIQPTITDANLVIGRLDPEYFLGGELRLDAERARAALATLTQPLGLAVGEVADAIISVSIENMAGAVRLVTVDRGFDYREFDLVAFGGAGPLHAAEIADRMGMRRVVVPPSPGLVSAFGAVIADERVDRRVTVVRRLDRPEAGDIAAELGRLAESVVAELAAQRRSDEAMAVSTHVACRYLGQNYEQEVRMYSGHVDKTYELAVQIAPDAPDFARRLADGFHSVHRAAYGYDLPDEPIQSVYLGATALVSTPPVIVTPYGARRGGSPQVRRRNVLVAAGQWVEAAILRRAELPQGFVIEGPAIIEEPDSTTYVPPAFVARVDDTWCLILERRGEGTR
ncbi:MAG TPA: hydantoinase/oxoprolinase family protein [Candidatus Dormibacteraeota bacterium]|nr:hydantoinase/oxoprolinase family protein [Candidatus Dormibacteraeota bacterium]